MKFWRENPFVRILMAGCVVLVSFLVVRNPWQGSGLFAGMMRLVVELIIFGGLTVLLIALFLGLFSCFVLPIQGIREFLQVWGRLGLFTIGGHGQAIWVRDGSVEDSDRNAGNWRHPSDLSSGTRPGVLILDAASGAQLRTSKNFTRTVGPGLTFIRKREYLAGMVFLGRRVSFPPLRPSNDEEPFAPQGEKEADDEYQERIERRKGVSGYTRDGVETLATMLVGFRLDSDLSRRDVDPGDDIVSKTLFKYNPVAVCRAVNAEAINSEAQNFFGSDRHIPWDDLPGYLVVDLWREYLRKFTLTELFSEFPEGRDFAGMTALEVIRERVRARLTQPTDVVLDIYGNVIQQRAPSREYHLLRNWGIKVLFVPIRNPQFSSGVEQTLVEKWFSFWKWRAEDEQKFIERKRKYMCRKGRIQALSVYVDILLQKALYSLPVDFKERKNLDQMIELLSVLLDATKQLCISDTELQRVVEDEEAQIVKVIDWLNWLRDELNTQHVTRNT